MLISSKRKGLTLAVFSGLLIAVGVTGFVLSVCGLDAEQPFGSVIPIAGAVFLVLGAVGAVISQNATRHSILRDENPTAFIVDVASLRGSAAQMRSLCSAFGVRKKFSLNYNMTLVVNSASVRFYRGGLKPSLILQVPTNVLIQAGATAWATAQGTPAIERVELVFDSNAGVISCLFAFGNGFIPRMVHNEALAAELSELRAIAGVADRTGSLEKPLT